MNKMCILFVMLLTGCMVGPDYHRPWIDVPEKFYFEEPQAQDTLDLAWWELFEDPVLRELITVALENNLDVQTAAANIDTAIGILIQVWAPFFPQFGYDVSYTRFRTSETLATTQLPFFSFPNPQTTWQALGTVNWQIDLWGRIRRQAESALANVYSSYEARRQIILSLVSSVADAYFILRGLDEQLNIAIRTMESYYDAVVYFELQFKYGQESLMAVAQAKTQYEYAAAQIPFIKSQIVQTENAINILLSQNPQPIPRGKTIYEIKLPPIPEGLPSELLCQRPDIREAEYVLISANAQIGAAVALYFPSLSLTGLYGGASQELSNLFSGPSRTWTLAANVVGPLYTFGAIYGQVFSAEAQTEAALLQYEQTIIKAFSEVETALNDHAMLVEQIKAEEKLVEAAGQYTDLAIKQYKGGYSPYFVVIQAQQQYFPAELALALSKAELFSSIVNVYQTMGGGWVDIAETIANECP